MGLEGKRVLVTGGTGSLGNVLIRRLLSGSAGTPAQIIVFSRDEAKQHYMRLDFERLAAASTEEVVFNNFRRLLTFRVGDVRDFNSIAMAMDGVDVVFNAAALKQVPTCEYFPYEAVNTNITGAENIVRAIRVFKLKTETVIGVSTDKAAKPVNVMGMTKAIQERIFTSGNLYCPSTRFVCVRYGNVLASRGSVIPLFHEQLAAGGPLTVTTPDMTRFLLSMDQAVNTILEAANYALRGELFVPRVRSARVYDIAKVLIGDRDIPIRIVGIRPGEKIHEILISEEEAHRTYEHNSQFYVLKSMLPELWEATPGGETPCRSSEYSSQEDVLEEAGLRRLLDENGLLFAAGQNFRHQ